MQTFLVNYQLEENAKALDNKRLFKQLLEGYQILNSLIGNKKGWQNHPAVKQWKGYEYQLYEYIYSCRLECDKRQIALDSEIFNKASELIAYLVANNKLDKKKKPDWWGRLDILKSHKARLYCKGTIDAYCAAIKKEYKIKSIDKWLKEKFKKTKNELRWADLTLLKNWVSPYGYIEILPNHYAQFGWQNEVDFDPSIDYIWPVSKE